MMKPETIVSWRLLLFWQAALVRKRKNLDHCERKIPDEHPGREFRTIFPRRSSPNSKKRLDVERISSIPNPPRPSQISLGPFGPKVSQECPRECPRKWGCPRPEGVSHRVSPEPGARRNPEATCGTLPGNPRFQGHFRGHSQRLWTHRARETPVECGGFATPEL